jgi:chromosome segregation ATPase
MKVCLIILVILSGLFASAQKDTVDLLKTISLDSSQQRWLKNNYLLINKQSKEVARATIVKEFPSISNPSVELIIGEAGRMAKDNRMDVAALTQQIQELNSQIQSLGEAIEKTRKKLEALEEAREKLEEIERKRERAALLKELDRDRTKMIELDSLLRFYKSLR